MRQVVIENPVLNSPYEEPKRHFKFDEEGITDEVLAERRVSSYFVPIAQPRTAAWHRSLNEEPIADRRDSSRRLLRTRKEGIS